MGRLVTHDPATSTATATTTATLRRGGRPTGTVTPRQESAATTTTTEFICVFGGGSDRDGGTDIWPAAQGCTLALFDRIMAQSQSLESGSVGLSVSLCAFDGDAHLFWRDDDEDQY